MKRQLLLILLVLMSESAYAEWVPVQKEYLLPGLQTVYIDPTTIERDGALVTLWQLTDYKWMQGGPRSTPRFLSTTIQKQFDCMEKRFRLLAYTEFSHRMASGTAADGLVDQEMWLPVKPASMSQSLWEVACGKE